MLPSVVTKNVDGSFKVLSKRNLVAKRTLEIKTMPIDKINDLKLHNTALANELREAVNRVLASGWFVLGPEVNAFEDEFASYCGVPYCVSVANGTDALELAMRGVGVEAGDEVITVANAGMYATTAILSIGAQAIYADVDSESMNLSAAAAGRLITTKTKAIVATHLFGKMAEMPQLRKLADKFGIPLIEDCAQSHGAILEDKQAGAWGDIASFSFYPTKNLGAIGDGGAVVCSDSNLADRVKALRQYGWKGKYNVCLEGGRNSRLDELQAAVLRVKLKKLDGWNIRRREIAEIYHREVVNPQVNKKPAGGADYVAHLYVICLENRDSLQRWLATKGIASEIHYPVLDCDQMIQKTKYLTCNLDLPVSRAVVGQILTLPCYPELLDEEVLQVCEGVNEWSP